MQSKLIELKLAASKTVIITITLVLIVSISLLLNFANLPAIVRLIPMAVITISLSVLIYSVIIYFSPKIDIIVDKNKIILWMPSGPIIARLISTHQYTFMLTIMSLQIATKQINIPIFIGSVPMHEYKALRVFLAWH